jgi:hypothetical protein
MRQSAIAFKFKNSTYWLKKPSCLLQLMQVTTGNLPYAQHHIKAARRMIFLITKLMSCVLHLDIIAPEAAIIVGETIA